MRLEVEYIRFDKVDGRLVQQDGRSREIIEIDEKKGDDFKIISEALSIKIGVSAGRYKIMNFKKI